MTTAHRTLPNYVIVTPVRDEASYIASTIDSVKVQTHRPVHWVIVDDGSADCTPDILRAHTHGLSWITVITTGSSQRQLGSAEVLAFQQGIAALDPNLNFEFIVKLDGDLRLPRDYFERLLQRMAAHPDWGIASGVYCEQQAEQTDWMPVAMPAYHAAGASKVIRRACYDQIGGFVARKGWDTVDEIRAGLLGWKTGHFDDIRFQHLKPEGMAMGTLRTHFFHGEIYYQTGGGTLFLLAKVIHRMVMGHPPIIGGLAMLWGYLTPWLLRRPRLVNREEARYYRTMLNSRLAKPLMRLLTSSARS